MSTSTIEPITRHKGSTALSPATAALVTMLALVCFAANSLICRAALKHTGPGIDAASFTAIRLLSGAFMLWAIVQWQARMRGTEAGQTGGQGVAGNWISALALFTYAAGFSFGYVHLPTATGALILIGTVQTTMIGCGLWLGERLSIGQALGILLALGGVVYLLLPGLSAPPFGSAAVMIASGIGWAVYSLRGRGAGDPMANTAGNFIRSIPFAIVLVAAIYILQPGKLELDPVGTGYAIFSGAITSGLGYVLWYMVLPGLKATTAASLQLSVPVLAIAGGILFLHEAVSATLWLCSLAILGGILLVIFSKKAVPK